MGVGVTDLIIFAKNFVTIGKGISESPGVKFCVSPLTFVVVFADTSSILLPE